MTTIDTSVAERLAGAQSSLAAGRVDDCRDRHRADRVGAVGGFRRSRRAAFAGDAVDVLHARSQPRCTTSTSSTAATISCACGRSSRRGRKESSSSAAAAGAFSTRRPTSIRCVAAPFIWLFGTNGFLVLHALLMTACFACAYAFLSARSHPVAALIFAFAFLFVSLVPIYMVQIGPDFFIFAIVLFGYFFWCYKEVGGPPADRPNALRHALAAGATIGRHRRGVAGSRDVCEADQHRTDHAAARFGGAAKAVGESSQDVGACLAGRSVVLFALNVAFTGDWNYQGGERKTFYGAGDGTFAGGFPYQNDASTFDSVGTSAGWRRLVRRSVHARRAVGSLPPQSRLLPVRSPHRFRRLLPAWA